MATVHTWTVPATGVTHSCAPMCAHTRTHTHTQCVHTHMQTAATHTHLLPHVYPHVHMCTHTQPHAGLQLHALPLLHLLPCNQSPGPGTRHPGRNMTQATRGHLPPRPVGASRLAMQPSGPGCPGGNVPILGQSHVPRETSPSNLRGQGAGAQDTHSPALSSPGAALCLRAQEGLTRPPSKPLPTPTHRPRPRPGASGSCPPTLARTCRLCLRPHPGQWPQPKGVGLAPGTRWMGGREGVCVASRHMVGGGWGAVRSGGCEEWVQLRARVGWGL